MRVATAAVLLGLVLTTVTLLEEVHTNDAGLECRDEDACRTSDATETRSRTPFQYREHDAEP
jgi:hypothetical protein